MSSGVVRQLGVSRHGHALAMIDGRIAVSFGGVVQWADSVIGFMVMKYLRSPSCL